MKVTILSLLLAIWGSEASAAIYKCKSTIGAIESFVHSVDTDTHLQFIWLFRDYPDAQPWCGSRMDSDKLTCELRSVFSGSKKIYARADIQIGDRALELSTPDCGSEIPCKIECALQSNSAE